MPLIPEYFSDLEGFEWDHGNDIKNWKRHQVTQAEAEQVFLNRPVLVTETMKAGLDELRYAALGVCNSGKALMIVFTIRDNKIRVISARAMSKKERQVYAQVEN